MVTMMISIKQSLIRKEIKQIVMLTLAPCLVDISRVKTIKRREALITNVINSNNSNGNDLQKSDKKIALIQMELSYDQNDRS